MASSVRDALRVLHAATARRRLTTWVLLVFATAGVGHTDDMALPQHVVAHGLRGERISSVACGAGHTLALTADGRVFAWYATRVSVVAVRRVLQPCNAVWGCTGG